MQSQKRGKGFKIYVVGNYLQANTENMSPKNYSGEYGQQKENILIKMKTINFLAEMPLDHKASGPDFSTRSTY